VSEEGNDVSKVFLSSGVPSFSFVLPQKLTDAATVRIDLLPWDRPYGLATKLRRKPIPREVIRLEARQRSQHLCRKSLVDLEHVYVIQAQPHWAEYPQP
jgi:hypothetical protein